MSNPLAPNITRVVVREWLASKSAVLDAILHEIVNQLTPVAQQHAAALVYCSIDPDPRESLIEDLQAQILAMLNFLTDLEACPGDEELPNHIWETAGNLSRRLSVTWAMLRDRRSSQLAAAAAPSLADAIERGDE